MLDDVWRAGLSLVSPGGSRARLSILIFHRVVQARDPLRPGEPTPAEFEQLMRMLQRRFRVMPLAEAVDRLRGGRLPSRALSITFDDGYADNWTLAAPILRRLGLHATFFIATGYLDGGCMFNDAIIHAVGSTLQPQLDLSDIGLGVCACTTTAERVQAVRALLSQVKYFEPAQRNDAVIEIAERAGVSLPADLMMTSSQASMLAAEFDLGGHTVNHPILSKVDPAIQRREIVEGKRRLEEITGRSTNLFAYPNGIPGRDYGSEAVILARQAGFEAALSTSAGYATRQSDLFQLPRFTPWTTEPDRFSAMMLRNLAVVNAQQVAA